MKEKKTTRRVGILTLALCLILTMVPLSAWAVGETYDGKVTSVKAYSTYKGIDLEWPAVPGAAKYYIFEGNTKIGETPSTNYYVSLAAFSNHPDDEIKHTYKVYAVDAKGTQSTAFAQSEPKTQVLGIKYNCTIKKNVKLECKCHRQKRTLKGGTSFTAYEFSVGCYRAVIDGHKYAFKRIRLKGGINAKGYYNSSTPYSPEEMTRYVNRRGLTSKRNTMVVVSTRSQYVYLFKGSKGNWKIDKYWMVATGSPKTPTPSGQTTIKRKWSKHNGQRWWSATPTFSFHTNSKAWGALGKPKSGGCVRNPVPLAKYIYNNYKVKTRVCVI